MNARAKNAATGRSRRAILGLVLAVVAYLAVNSLADNALRRVSWDVTDEALYTLTDSTRQILSEIDEPITLRLYFSSLLGERAPSIKTYHQRVTALLEQYADLADGMIRLEYHDPEPFSVVEDRAVGFGLEGFPVTDAGDRGYFGLAATNATDDIETVPFFTQDREEFLEYDLTRIVHSLSNPERPTVGILTTIPMMGGEGGQPPMALMEQLREFFRIEVMATDATSVPEGVDVLMIVHPYDLSDATLYAIDQFVLNGGRALVFVDPVAEVAGAGSQQTGIENDASEFNRMLNAWGVSLVDGVVAGDLDTARRVSIQHQGQVIAIDYVGWLSFGVEQFDTADAAMSELATINVATAGVLENTESGTATVSPLIRTGPRSMRIDADRFEGEIDAVALFSDFEESGERQTIAARIAGDVATAFPDGPPANSAASGDHRERSTEDANIVVVADVDMLANQMWLDRRSLLNQTIDIPLANNADFVVNTLENLAGNSALINLRGRSSTLRPFHMIEDIRQAAEIKYRNRENDLTARLGEIEAQLQGLISRADAAGSLDNIVISDADREKIDRYRTEMLDIRADLRAVRHALRKDIEALNDRIKLINIALVPAVLVAAALIAGYVRRRRRRVRVAQA